MIIKFIHKIVIAILPIFVFFAYTFFPGNYNVEADSSSITITDNSDWQFGGDDDSRWVQNKKTGEYLSGGWYLIDYGTQLLHVDAKGEYIWHGYTSKEKADYYKCSPININNSDYSYKFERDSYKLRNVGNGEKLAQGWYNYKDLHWWYFDSEGYACMDNFTSGYPNGTYDSYYVGCYSWYEDSNGWYYMNESGDYLKSEIAKIDGTWYLFDSDGYLGKANTWYDLGYEYPYENKWISDWWYVGSEIGIPCTGWEQVDGNWYYWYAGSQGKQMMETNTWIDGWYLDKEGIGHQGAWYEDSNGWYYMADNGKYVTSYIELDGVYYMFDSSGYWTGKTMTY